jgi:hypothetical protein
MDEVKDAVLNEGGFAVKRCYRVIKITGIYERRGHGMTLKLEDGSSFNTFKILSSEKWRHQSCVYEWARKRN